MIKYVWHNESVPKGMLITQVSGILIDEENKVLLYEEDDGKYRIPGGHPIDNEDISSTLIRECLEEVNTEIENIKYLGFQEVKGDRERESYAQVRMIARIKNIGEEMPDIDNGKIYKRILVCIDDVNKYLNWSDVGDAMIEEVKKLLNSYFTH